MFFYRVALRILNYFVDYDRVLPKLEGTGLRPCRFFNGKAIVSLIFFNYQNVTIGAYEEAVISIMVHPESLPEPRLPFSTLLFRKKGENWKHMGAYVLEMPVTIPAARAAGREIWGFPKFLTQIPYRLAGNAFEFGVQDPDTDEAIVSVKGEMGAGFTARAFDFVSFTNYEDAIWKVIVETDGKVKNCTCKRVEVTPGTGGHRMAKNVRDLGLAEEKPFVIMASDSCRTRLMPGRPIAEWKSPPLPYPHPEEIEFQKKQG